MTRLAAFLLRFFWFRLGDTSLEADEFPPLDAHASVWIALPCPNCGKRLSAHQYDTHVQFCHAEEATSPFLAFINTLDFEPVEDTEDTKPMPPLVDDENWGTIPF